MPTVRASAIQSLPVIPAPREAAFQRAVDRLHELQAERARLDAEIDGLVGTADQPGQLWRAVEQYGQHDKADLPRDSQVVGAGCKWQIVGSSSTKIDHERAVQMIELATVIAGSDNRTQVYNTRMQQFTDMLVALNGPDYRVTDARVQAALATCRDLEAGQAIKVTKTVDTQVWAAFERNERVAPAVRALKTTRETYGLKQWDIVDEPAKA